ncbi:MAG: lipopolysaccharide biosynthesis protein [Candidatus Paceibacterota bacterium]
MSIADKRTQIRSMVPKEATTSLLAPTALIDQAIVSGTNFLAFALLGRMCGAAELGVYSITFSLHILSLVASQSLVVTPYVNLVRGRRGRSLAGFTGNAIVLVAAIGLCSAGLAGVVGFALQVAGETGLAQACYALSLALPFTAVREFIRRYQYARLHVASALCLDAVASALHLAALLMLAAADAISASTAWLGAGFSSAVVAGAYLTVRRGNFRVEQPRIGLAAIRYWRFGKWVFATEAATPLRSQFLNWLLFATGGVAAAGLFAACMSVTRLMKPFFMAATNISEPLLVRAYRDGGVRLLRRRVHAITLLMGVTMLPLCLVIHLQGSNIMSSIFGRQYDISGGALSLLVSGMFISLASVPATLGMRTLRRPELAFTSRISGLAACFAIAIALAPSLGVNGVAIAILAGSSLSAAVRWNIFRRLTVPASTEADPEQREVVPFVESPIAELQK